MESLGLVQFAVLADGYSMLLSSVHWLRHWTDHLNSALRPVSSRQRWHLQARILARGFLGFRGEQPGKRGSWNHLDADYLIPRDGAVRFCVQSPWWRDGSSDHIPLSMCVLVAPVWPGSGALLMHSYTLRQGTVASCLILVGDSTASRSAHHYPGCGIGFQKANVWRCMPKVAECFSKAKWTLKLESRNSEGA
jgi:hypothetical protein